MNPTAADWIALAHRQHAAGMHRKAVRSYQRVLPENLEQLIALVGRLQQRGDVLGVEACYDRLLTARPDLAAVRVRLGLLLLGAGRLDEAVLVCDAAPQMTARLLGLRGAIAHTKQDVGQAIGVLRQAVRMAPNDPWILGNLASALEEGNHNEEARRMAERALVEEPGHPLATSVLSVLDRSSGRADRAAARLEASLQQTQAPAERAWMLHGLGIARDRLKDADGAFAAFVEFNDLRRRMNGSPAVTLPAVLDQQRVLWAAQNEWPQRTVSDDGFDDPVFVVGFPRSGTSLTREMLDAHPGLLCTDEQRFLPNLLQQHDEMSPAAIAGLSNAEIASMRAQYWASVQAVYPLGSGVRLVDKLPLNLIHAGLIARLFPRAHVVVLIRDPRDCCLSGFMQDFKSNAAMDCFYRLEDAAQLYASVFSLWEQLQQIPELTWTSVRYEDIVDNAEQVMREALSFLGLPWNDAVLSYAQRAKHRHIGTPSHQDVQKPIFRRSLARWRRYAHHMEAILPVLEPFAVAHGYPPA